MGRYPAPGSLPPPSETVDDRPRLRRLDGGAGDRRSGDEVEIDRPSGDLSFPAQRSFRARRLQGRPPQLPVLGRAAAATDFARRCALARLGVAATRIPASVLRAR